MLRAAVNRKREFGMQGGEGQPHIRERHAPRMR